MYSLALSLSLLLPLVSAFNTYRSTLTDCLNDAEVPILLSSSNGWSDAIEPFNLRFTPVPQVVAIPRGVNDVQGVMRCACQTNTQITVKGGGHSYGAYALSGTLIMDMVEFQDINLDITTGIVIVGAGLRLGNLANTIFELGGRALPHGTCAAVGIGGHCTLGGFGYSSRYWGLCTDTIVAFDVVLPDGNTAFVTESSNPDLFWALRGAGAGLVVVTAFHMQTQPAPPININWGYTYRFATAADAAAAFKYASEWGYDNAPKELGFGIVMSEGQLVVQGVYFGSVEEYDVLIAPLLAEMKILYGGREPEASSVQELGWIDSLTFLAGGPLVLPPGGDDSHDTFYVKSIETHGSEPLSLESLTGFFEYLYDVATPTGSGWFIIANLYGGGDSVITSFPPSTDPSSTSSYAGRDAGYVWQLYGQTATTLPPFIDDIVGFIAGMVDAFGAEVADLPAYPAYADTEFDQAASQERYWGAGAERLRGIKAVLDPKGIVYNPQGF